MRLRQTSRSIPPAGQPNLAPIRYLPMTMQRISRFLKRAAPTTPTTHALARDAFGRTRFGTVLLSGVLTAAAAVQPTQVQAQGIPTAEQLAPYANLLRARKFVDLERLANESLGQNASDVAALLAKSNAILGANQHNRLDEAASLAERCIAAAPQYSNCHEALGNALGVKAMVGGMLSAMGFVGQIRDSFKTAVDLNAANHSARFSLMQFYMAAPSIVGGGVGKARQLVADTQKTQPDAAQLLQAAIDVGDKQWAKAEAVALAANTSASGDLADQQRNLLLTVGSGYVNDKKFGDGQRVFLAMQKRFPDSEWPSYGLGRVAQEQGKLAEAIVLFDQALAVRSSAVAWFRKGQAFEAMGDKAKAVLAFETAVAHKPALGKSQLADAKERIKQLKV